MRAFNLGIGTGLTLGWGTGPNTRNLDAQENTRQHMTGDEVSAGMGFSQFNRRGVWTSG